MPLLNFPNELLLEIASYLSLSSISHLILTNRFLSNLLTPLLHTGALKPVGRHPALCWAVIHNHEPLIRLLLQKGVNVNQRNDLTTDWGHDPCRRTGLPQLVRSYIEGATILHFAAMCAPPSTIELLLNAGADVHVEDKQGNFPLLVAVRWSHYDAIRLLLEAGANVNHHHMPCSPVLGIAVWLRDVEMTRIILTANPNLEVDCDRFGNTPLHFACLGERGTFRGPPRPEIVKMLLDAGADANAVNMIRGDSPLHLLATWRAKFPATEIMFRMLVEKGADVNAKNNDGKTAYSISVGHLTLRRLAKLLVEAGADTSSCTEKRGFLETIIALLRHR